MLVEASVDQIKRVKKRLNLLLFNNTSAHLKKPFPLQTFCPLRSLIVNQTITVTTRNSLIFRNETRQTVPHVDYEVNIRNIKTLMLESNPLGMCACMHLIGQNSTILDDLI